MTSGLFDLGALVVLSAVLGVIARLLKQPIILAYLLAGVIVGQFGIVNLGKVGSLQVFSDLGIMFLLFLVGLEINYTSLRLIGKTVLALGLAQIAITSGLGYGLALLLGFAHVSALYIGAALSFASTIVVVKLLSEKKDLGSLYGKLSLGLLLVQDSVAIFLLVLLGGVQTGQGLMWGSVAVAILKGGFLFGLMLWMGRSVLPAVFNRAARSQELLFLISLAWVFLVAAVVSRFGFSIEIAGLLSGLALANSAEHFQIAGRIRSLRDFFMLMFFVTLGSSLVISEWHGLLLPILICSLFVLIVNPLVVISLMGFFGYRKRTSFMTGMVVGHISEFSLILIGVGVRLHQVPDNVASLITAVAIVSITISSYCITHANHLFGRVRKFLSFFERRNPRREGGFDETPFHKKYVLIGANRIGESIMRHLPEDELVVVEFDPDVVARLTKKGIDHVFGDIVDPEMYERIDFNSAKLVISTSPDMEDNLHLLEMLNLLTSRPRVIVRAENDVDADILYSGGADYVLLPHVTSGQYLGKTLAVDPEMKVLESLRMSDMEMMGKV
jgi:Kef-type K+ transport system membrane component KefB